MIKAINTLRFPLIILVVVLHANMPILHTDWLGWYLFISRLFSENISRIAVPCFFLISGYLLFYNITTYGHDIYKAKIKRRITTLLVPYCVWNLLYILWMELRRLPIFSDIFPNMQNVRHTFEWYLQCFWALENDMPILYPMWYIRNLIILILLSPIVYILIKKFRFLWIIFLILLYILDGEYDFKMPVGLKISSTLYFSLGAFYSMNKTDLTKFLKYRIVLLCLFIAMVFLTTLFTGNLRNLYFPIMIFTGSAVALVYSMKYSLYFEFLNKSAFFVFAFHVFIIRDVQKVLLMLTNVNNSMQLILIYFSSIIITILCSLIIFCILRYIFPQITNILCGHRSN